MMTTKWAFKVVLLFSFFVCSVSTHAQVVASWVSFISVLPSPQMRLVPNPEINYHLDSANELVRVDDADVQIDKMRFIKYSSALGQSDIPIEHVQVVRQLTLGSEWSDNRYIMYTNSVDYAGYIGIIRIPRNQIGTVDRNHTKLVFGMRVGDGSRDGWGQLDCYPDSTNKCIQGSGDTYQSSGARKHPNVPIQSYICIDSKRCADIPATNVNHPAAVSQMGPSVVVQCQDGGVDFLFQGSNHAGGYCFLDIRNPESPKWIGMLRGGSDGGAKAAVLGYSSGYVYLIIDNYVWRFYKQYWSPLDFAENFRYDFSSWKLPHQTGSQWNQLNGCDSFEPRYVKAEAHSQNYSIQLDTYWNSWFINERQGRDGIHINKMVFYDNSSNTYSDHMQDGTDCILLDKNTERKHLLKPTSHHCGDFVNSGSNWDPISQRVELVCADEGEHDSKFQMSIMR